MSKSELTISLTRIDCFKDIEKVSGSQKSAKEPLVIELTWE
jgi:hypothetical protein